MKPEAAHRAEASVSLVLSVFAWSLSPVFIRWLSDAYDPYTMSFLRYFWATALLVPVSLAWFRRELFEALRASRALLGIAAVNLAMQTMWQVAGAVAHPTVVQLISRLSIVFVILLSYLAFREERAVIRSAFFLAGVALSFVGVAGVLMPEPRLSLLPRMDLISLLLLGVAFLGAVYNVWSKHAVMKLHPFAMFTVVAAYTTLGAAAVAWGFGSKGGFFTADARTTGILVVSGLFSIALAHPSYNHAQKYLGAAFCSVALHLSPFVTHLFAMALWPEEPLSAAQWLGGLLLIAGVLLVVRARVRFARGIQPPPLSGAAG
ncbi:MAG TPA: DMT family transporter [Candidatus Hydrogenedentes bacterium]|nr:DMT family transporter [Candidatus Hydrogenedentota bacterium]HNT87636.1 DMT family transporter [Candidatus Hydrogenedentota bacterium]